MSLKGYIPYTQSFFGGAWTAQDRATVDPRGALLAKNVRFYGPQVSTRYGWGVAFTLATQPASAGYLNMFNWVSDLGNYLIWMSSLGDIHAALISTVAPTDILIYHPSSGGGWNSTFAQAGTRLFHSYWTPDTASAGPTTIGTGNANVITKTGSTFALDAIIPGPPSTTLVPATAPTEPGAGVVTAGTHKIGLRMLHRSGFLGRPGPDTSTSANPTTTTYAPISFTSAGGKNLNWTFTPGANWPIDVVQVQLVMSTILNPNRLFLVPGAVQAVTGGAATAVNITINIDDDALVANATECTDSLNFYTASATGQAYMQVSVVAHIGNRMFYVSTLPDNNGNKYSVIFASDPGNFQQISLNQHVIQLPNQVKITTVFGVQAAIYIAGPHWTYMTEDTGGVPATWPDPKIVDGRKGVLYPNCIDVNVNGLYAWIADKTGFYLFNGSYSELPISWRQNDQWGTIVFPRASMVIKDDSLRHVVRVLATQAGNLTSNFIFKWDYTNGTTPETARFSIDDINPVSGTGAADSMEIVQNDLNSATNNNIHGAPELWTSTGLIFAGGTAYFSREKNPAFDTNLYRDEGSSNLPIHAQYEPNIFPGAVGYFGQPGSVGGGPSVWAYHGSLVRIVGAKTITPKLYSFDKTSNINLPAINLDSPAEDVQLALGYMLSKGGFMYHFEQNVLDGFFTLTDLTMYYKPWASHV